MSMRGKNSFPQEHYIELKGLSPYIVARINISEQANRYHAEVDLVLQESGKIYQHVTMLYNQEDARETLDLAVHYLKKYLDKFRNN